MKWLKKKDEGRSLMSNDFKDSFNDLFNRFFDDDFFLSNEMIKSEWNPKVDITENKKEIIVKADLPGIEDKDLNVEVEGNVLTIKGQREDLKEEKGTDYHRVERCGGMFSRSFTLPEYADASKIGADYQKGVLVVRIPKMEKKEQKQRKIEVKVK